MLGTGLRAAEWGGSLLWGGESCHHTCGPSGEPTGGPWTRVSKSGPKFTALPPCGPSPALGMGRLSAGRSGFPPSRAGLGELCSARRRRLLSPHWPAEETSVSRCPPDPAAQTLAQLHSTRLFPRHLGHLQLVQGRDMSLPSRQSGRGRQLTGRRWHLVDLGFLPARHGHDAAISVRGPRPRTEGQDGGGTSEGNGNFGKTFVVGSLAAGFYSQKTTHRIAVTHAAGSRAVAFCGAHAFSFSKIPTRYGPLGI